MLGGGGHGGRADAAPALWMDRADGQFMIVGSRWRARVPRLSGARAAQSVGLVAVVRMIATPIVRAAWIALTTEKASAENPIDEGSEDGNASRHD